MDELGPDVSSEVPTEFTGDDVEAAAVVIFDDVLDAELDRDQPGE